MPDPEQDGAPTPGVGTPPRDVARRAVQGAGWLFGRRLATGILTLAATAILARSLAPAAFGLVALAQVLMRFLSVVDMSGFGLYVIADRDAGREDRIQAAFWLNILSSTVIVLACAPAVPLIARFYGEPELTLLMSAIAARYWIGQLAVIPDALLGRSLEYKTLVIRDTARDVLASAGSVALALAGFGAWSLILPSLAIAPFQVALAFRLARWAPRPALYVRHWPRVGGFSARLMGTEFVNTVIAEGDTLVIGKFLGSGALGIYNIAWQTANLVSRNVSGIVGKMAMPVLCAVAGEPDRLRAAYYRILGMLSLICTPALVGLFVVADEFVLTLYGPRWAGSVPVLRCLLIYAVRRAVGAPAGVMLNVLGRPDIGLKYSLIQLPCYVISILYGVRYGILGVAIATAAVRTVFGIILFKIVAIQLGSRFRDTLGVLAPTFTASCLMGLVVVLAGFQLEAWCNGTAAILGFKILIGCVAYPTILALLPGNHISELTALIGSLMKRTWSPQRAAGDPATLASR